jgi:FMN phosphatase YigB (HAD superfamily)
MHIVFDFDHTLFNTAQLWQDWLDQLENCGVDRADAVESGERLFGIGFSPYNHGEQMGLQGDELDQLVSDFEEYTRQESEQLLYKDVEECIKKWGDEHSFSILTFGHSEYQHSKIEAAGLNDLIDDVRIAMPERTKATQIAEMLKEIDEPIMFVDDNPRELQAVAELGLEVQLVRMRRKGGRHSDEFCKEDGEKWQSITSLSEMTI